MPQPEADDTIARVQDTLVEHGGAAAFAEFERFGEMMMTEVVSRTTTIETKAQNVIGWAAALIAVLLASGGTLISSLELILVGAVASVLAVAFAAGALLLQKWSWPSVNDWFCLDLIGNPHKLRAYHLVSQLETHKEHHARNERKARLLGIAQWALVVAAVCFGVALIVTSAQKLLAPAVLPEVPRLPPPS